MPIVRTKKTFIFLLAFIIITVSFFYLTRTPKIDFSSQVKPIINTKCISCHGGVKKERGFSLLFEEEALAATASGKPAIIPGKPEESEMIRRLLTDDPEERMPYKHDPLSKDQIDILKKWVAQGAKWGEHWAYLPVEKQEIPSDNNYLFGLFKKQKSYWGNNAIDRFILAELTKQQLQPSPQADKNTLVRRAALDIIGIPPSSSLATNYLQHSEDDDYEKFIDTLLSMPQFGERWAAVWLDVARYADTKGYERDYSRSVWKYRDWLIRAFNNDMPYDQFLIEQLAGDLLPDPSADQLIATAFHRNSMTNDEGGSDNEEYRVAAVIDRINTTWEGLMGTTFSCVQCHSHPYDPFKYEEYYKFMAFFNNSRDEDTWADYPLLRSYENEDSIKYKQIIHWLNNNNFTDEAKSANLFLTTLQPSYNSQTADSLVSAAIVDTKWLILRNNASARLSNVYLDKRNQLIMPVNGFVNGGVITIRTGQKILAKIPVNKTNGWKIMKVDFPPQNGYDDIFITYYNSNLRDNDANCVQFDWFYFSEKIPGNDIPGYNKVVADFWELINKQVVTTPVMMENPEYMSRTTHVFDRGNWMVKGEEVEPDVPESLHPLPEGAPRNRKGLAMWLVDKKNPLTARTMVNRVWEQLFGVGLVETLEDMGTQGLEPSHKELLDYLSYQFMYEYQWSVKKLIREIVLSATYRQDAKVKDDLLARDQFNKFYARGPRVRLSAEQIRDQALAVSGLLSNKMYGPGVMPWQPDNIWMTPYNGDTWNVSKGEDQYRRAIYTYWKRTAPYPSMITFDGVGREVCSPRRIRTNTPLQALVTLNDSVYFDVSRQFTNNINKHYPAAKPSEKIAAAYKLILFKTIDTPRLEALMQLYQEALDKFTLHKKMSNDIMGENKDTDPQNAALVVVMGALLNLDEVLTKS